VLALWQVRDHKEVTVAFFCPVCNKRISDNHLVTKAITADEHPGTSKCGGIGQMARYGHEVAKHQQKTNDKIAGENRSAKHKANNSARNANLYETPHKNAALQQARVDQAVKVGLPGHASANSNSKPNSGTTNKLKQIHNKPK
jgi:hypothetical protein